LIFIFHPVRVTPNKNAKYNKSLGFSVYQNCGKDPILAKSRARTCIKCLVGDRGQ